MKTLYLDCGMGAAGDMLAAALYELLPDDQRVSFLETMNALIPGVSVQTKQTKKCGIVGTKFSVLINDQSECIDAASQHATLHEHNHHHHQESHHHGRSVLEINQVIATLCIPEKARMHAQATYRMLSDAESQVHGEPVNQIHFHEVGELDAIADIVAFCLLIDNLNPDQVICSPVHVGTGHVRCAHGLLPVPAPATALLLKDVPIYGGKIQGELCTPTGAALLRHFCSFGDMPQIAVSRIGYGMGTKDFEAANCVRAFLGDTNDAQEAIWELRCNLDDMTPEAMGFALERLWESPVLDVFTIPISMKKSRPGTLLSCLCRKEDADLIVRLLFQHTTTLGIRQYVCNRYTLNRTVQTVSISGETVRLKSASGWGVHREKVEYEDAAYYARLNDLSFAEATAAILRVSQELPTFNAKE